MNELRSKKIRLAMHLIDTKHRDDVLRACHDKLAMPNRYGRRQHVTINPRRQLKKLVRRLAIA